MIHNVHERALAVAAAEVGALLDRLGGPQDVLWPTPAWAPMVLDRPVSVGAAGGHGSVRYRVTGYEPGRHVEFTFDAGLGLHGTHTLVVEARDASSAVLRHRLDARASGAMRLLWPLAVRWLHDAVLEDLLDRAEFALGTGPRRPARWSAWVRLIRLLEDAPRARETTVPDTPVLAAALPRVDYADAYTLGVRPGMPVEPQVWADAIFNDPPGWVVAVLVLGEALGRVLGMGRSDDSAFDTPLSRTPEEVLLGADSGHSAFRVSVLRRPDQVVISTVVQLHSRRARAHWAVLRRAHAVVARALLTRAARRLAVADLLQFGREQDARQRGVVRAARNARSPRSRAGTSGGCGWRSCRRAAWPAHPPLPVHGGTESLRRQRESTA